MSDLPASGGMSHRTKVFLGQVVTIVAFLALWEYASGRWVDAFFVSKPSEIAVKLWSELFEPSFYNDLWVTSLEMFGGYAIGGFGGVALGVLLARWPVAAQILDPIFVGLNSIPRIALAPLLIIWFGIDMTSKIVLAATLVFFLTFFNTLAGMLNVESGLINVARVQGATDWQIFTKVMLPAATSWIMTGLRTALPFALIGVIVGEFLAASVGLGFRLNMYSTTYNTTGTMAMLFVMMALMMLLNSAMIRIERKLLRWKPRSAYQVETSY
jgi:NitT/TauT family transport system permease protein